MLEIQMEQPQGFAAPHLLPIATLMLAGSLGVTTPAQAQSEEKTLKTVTVTDTQDPNLSKESLLVKQTGIAKGQQQLKDIPQTVTVMTEKLMADRNYDDFREVLKSVAGVTFQAGETGEEDVRMRGFSLGQAGDIYVDGLRDVPLIERDTFNTDRVEVLKGSASMLFGKGSTGGVVNQVNKQPFLMDQNETNVTLGSGQMKRVTADMNLQTDASSAFRVNGMTHTADNWGAMVNKKGIAGAYRTGIGERDEYTVGLYHLETNGRPLYNHPWLIDNGSSTASNNASGVIVPVLNAKNYYGLSSDYLKTQSSYITLGHTHRLSQDSELKTTLRYGHYERDLLASAMRFTNPTTGAAINDSTALSRGLKARRGESDVLQLQSDYNQNFEWLGRQHSLIAGVDFTQDKALRNNSATDGLPAALGTSVGTPNDGLSILDRRSVAMNHFKADNLGLYAQDTVSLTSQVKVLGGLRLDRFTANYQDTASNRFEMSESLWSPRVGAMWQPTSTATYYTSYGTSYNTSGDTYQFALGSYAPGSANAKAANTSPEKSRNLEVGSKFEIFEGKGLLGVALFHSEKYNERNTDADSAATQMLLSGKRHATGMEFNFAGRITPAWEMFYNHTWIPDATIDESNIAATGTGALGKGDRSALTPKHSASLWNTYRINSTWRLGGGLNYRGEQNPDGARTKVAAAFTTVDAMAEYALNDANLLKFNVNNLTNKLYADTLYRGFYGPGAPRRMELSWKSMF
ncbi:MAG: TonB-dependent siderophore receptor [Limnohabitans sp.]|nr:TonB-dependent siderophore receptor [Limnohabitans sp.]